MEIRIGKTGRKCFISERPFEHDEEVTSLVRLRDGQLEREDYALENWKAEYGKDALAVWATNYQDPAVLEQEPPEAYSPLRQVFYESVESQEREGLATAYLAAQLLRRQKVFRLIKESDAAEGDSRIALFADRIGNRLIEVRDPSLSYEEMESGRGALVTRLAELEAPPEEEDPDAEEGKTTSSGTAEPPDGEGSEGSEEQNAEPIRADSEAPPPEGDEESDVAAAGVTGELESDETTEQEA